MIFSSEKMALQPGDGRLYPLVRRSWYIFIDERGLTMKGIDGFGHRMMSKDIE